MKAILLSCILPIATALVAPTSSDHPSLAGRQASPRIAVTTITYQGSGCPSNSVTYTPDSQGVSVSFRYEAFGVGAGENAGAPGREECKVSVGLRYPVGCTSAVVDVTHRGFGIVDDGVTGSATAAYALAGSGASTSLSPAQGKSVALSYAALGRDNGAIWSSTDSVAISARVAGAAQRDAVFTITAAVGISTPRQSVRGVVQVDNLIVFIKNQAAC